MVQSRPFRLGLLVLALLGSLSANVYLAIGRVGKAPRAELSVSAASASGDPADGACRAELESCHRMASGLALGLWSRSSPEPGPPVAAPSAAAPSRDPSQSARDAICRVARKAMRDEWLGKRDEIAVAIAKDIPDAEKTREDAERDAKVAAGKLGLDGRQRAAFEADYAALRERRIAEMVPAVQATPVDWARLVDQATALFEEEDVLVERDVGAEAVARLREGETDDRVTILGILTTYADGDWDDALRTVAP
jgi:hypothetical protein